MAYHSTIDLSKFISIFLWKVKLLFRSQCPCKLGITWGVFTKRRNIWWRAPQHPRPLLRCPWRSPQGQHTPCHQTAWSTSAYYKINTINQSKSSILQNKHNQPIRWLDQLQHTENKHNQPISILQINTINQSAYCK